MPEVLNPPDYVIDTEPLSGEAEAELRRRLARASRGVALSDDENNVYAVVLTPVEFDLLKTAAQIAMEAGNLRRRQRRDATDRPMSLDAILKILRSRQGASQRHNSRREGVHREVLFGHPQRSGEQSTLYGRLRKVLPDMGMWTHHIAARDNAAASFCRVYLSQPTREAG